jgi:IS1 family transposase
MNKLPAEARCRVVSALVEGMSIRATVRMTGVAKNTVVKLLADLGAVCKRYHDEHVRDLKTKRVQADEIWCFCYAKQKNVPAAMRGQPGVGDVWTWTALDADSKLMIAWHIGGRSSVDAKEIMFDLADRVSDRIQITSDGWRPYVDGVYRAFGSDVDFAMLRKIYGFDRSGATAAGAGARYSPPECIGVQQDHISGWPEQKHISTSFVERSNLTMRMSMRRYTRLTNAFSKKVENLKHAVALHFLHYNFCRIHQTLRVTPAMEAGIADHVWEIEDIVGLLG